MVFFLIVVSDFTFLLKVKVFRRLLLMGNTLNTCVFAHQVIYKKFQIPCPLPSEFFNMTVNSTSAHLHNNNNTATAYNEDSCTPKYFVFNSQVQIQKIWANISLPRFIVSLTFVPSLLRLCMPCQFSPLPSSATRLFCPCMRNWKSKFKAFAFKVHLKTLSCLDVTLRVKL